LQLVLQDGRMADVLERAVEAEDAGADLVYVSDHFHAVRGTGDGATFESLSTLAALAAVTRRVRLGPLVASSAFRNPNLLADMARTIDQHLRRRLVLGLVLETWSRITTGTATPLAPPDHGSGARAVRDDGQARWRVLNPPPHDGIPILIGGGGERTTLRLVAAHADAWHVSGDAETFARKSAILDDWCARLGRDPGEIERAAFVANHRDSGLRAPGPYVAAGCSSSS